jgi:hypothetical protein
VGRFEADFFDPLAWRPEYPNPAFDNMRADDAFWAARLVTKFSDEAIRAVVAKARYSEPGAADHIAATLIKRRDKVLRAWLTGVNPVADPRLSADGTLTFENAAVTSGVTTAPQAYELAWSAFDNNAGIETSSDGGSETTRATEGGGVGALVSDRPASDRVTANRASAPSELLKANPYVQVAIRTVHPDFPAWNMAVVVTFRRTDTGWQTVGIDRTVPPRNRD